MAGLAGLAGLAGSAGSAGAPAKPAILPAKVSKTPLNQPIWSTQLVRLVDQPDQLSWSTLFFSAG